MNEYYNDLQRFLAKCGQFPRKKRRDAGKARTVRRAVSYRMKSAGPEGFVYHAKWPVGNIAEESANIKKGKSLFRDLNLE